MLLTDVELVGGVTPPPAPPPEPVPPQYDRLAELHLEISLVENGKAKIAIIVPESGVYDADAALIQQAIETRTGARVPVVSDDSPDAALPMQGNLIVLGNRSTSKTINTLYDRHYCLVDLKYPGPGGYVIRSVHNPFGDGNSVLVVGASDAIGMHRGSEAFGKILSQRATGVRSAASDSIGDAANDLAMGWTMETKLGQGVTPPIEIEDFETWEASQGYGATGYFGWCSLSKQMAMYYMTGNESSAREFVRLALPNEQAIRDIERIDGERVENKQDPLAGFYHYNAHLAILYWDLIEESPVFSDEERLAITNAFARQLSHRKGEGVYPLIEPPTHVGSRHDQWSAISLLCLGRYFDKHYPHPIWAQCHRSGRLAFQSLHRDAWVQGERDNLYWYSTGMAPVLTYLLLTGDREPVENGVVKQLLLGQQALLSGQRDDSAIRFASIGMLNKATYLTSDGRWITYRQRTEIDTDGFRLGQSFWPSSTIEPAEPADLAGKWTVLGLPRSAWQDRSNGLPLDQSFYFGSYRNTADASGDFLLLDGFNGASRNPYHVFSILQLRIDGQTILDGYHNQVLTSADGMVEPAVAMDAALEHADVVGSTATAVGRVPTAAFCDWRRTIAHRTGRYALVVDDLTFRSDSKNMNATTTWQTPKGYWEEREDAMIVPCGKETHTENFRLQCCDVQASEGSRVITMDWNGAVEKGSQRRVFYLIRRESSDSKNVAICARVAENAAALLLPERAVAVVGRFKQSAGKLVVLARDHLHGHAITQAGVGVLLFACDVPVDIDWDFSRGVANVVIAKPATLKMNLADPGKLRIDGEPIDLTSDGKLHQLSLPAGRYVITGASPPSEVRDGLTRHLAEFVADGQAKRGVALAAAKGPAKGAGKTSSKTAAASWQVAPLRVALKADVGDAVSDMITLDWSDGTRLAVAAGKGVHLLAGDGTQIRQLRTDGKVRVLRWWDEPELLLVGCQDEQVIAFTKEGQRKWSFRSEMAPEVSQAGKTYWYKTAPGHEGVHGLHSGPFDKGISRCFVGSACTLEILDMRGELVQRTPVFWGPGRKFLLTNGADDSKDLLISQWPNGYDHLAIVNSKTLGVTGSGFSDVPPGHSMINGWMAQNRTSLFRRDLDGDGKQEVVTTINGIWNRVAVYSEDGKPISNAQFGPCGNKAPRSRMRDTDITDLDGDGTLEMVVGVSDGLVVALNHKCEKKWATRLTRSPLSVKAVTAGGGKRLWIAVGCEDGSVVAIDQQGRVRRAGNITGRPDHIAMLVTPSGPMAVLATDQGEVKGFRVK